MRASDRAYRTLLDEIQSGRLAPGAVLGEVEQAARLGVSRTPLREALGRLAADGLVVQQSPRVTVVSDSTPATSASSSRCAARSRRPPPALPRSGGMPRPSRRSPTSSPRAPSTAQPRADAYYRLIARFDAALDGAVANDYLTAALRSVRTHLVRVRRLARDNPGRLAASVAEHRLIASAIAARDADLAAHATHVHLHNALASILGSLAEHAEGVPSRPSGLARPNPPGSSMTVFASRPRLPQRESRCRARSSSRGRSPRSRPTRWRSTRMSST